MLEASLKHCMSPSSSWRTDLWQMMNSGVVGFLNFFYAQLFDQDEFRKLSKFDQFDSFFEQQKFR